MKENFHPCAYAHKAKMYVNNIEAFSKHDSKTKTTNIYIQIMCTFNYSQVAQFILQAISSSVIMINGILKKTYSSCMPIHSSVFAVFLLLTQPSHFRKLRIFLHHSIKSIVVCLRIIIEKKLKQNNE